MNNRNVHLIANILSSAGSIWLVSLFSIGWQYRTLLFFLLILTTHLLISVRWPLSIGAKGDSWLPEWFKIGIQEMRMSSLRMMLLAIVVGYVALMVTLLIFPIGFIIVYSLAKRQSVVPAELTVILPITAFIIIGMLLRRPPAPLEDDEPGRFARIKRKLWQWLTAPPPWQRPEDL